MGNGNGGGETKEELRSQSLIYIITMNDSAEKNNYLHFGNNYIYTIEITLARYFSNTFFHITDKVSREVFPRTEHRER